MEQNQYYDIDSYQNQKKTKKPRNDAGAFIGGVVVGIFLGFSVVLAIVMVFYFTYMEKRQTVTEPLVQEEASAGKTVQTDGFLTQNMVNKIDSLVETIRKEFYLHEVSDEDLETGIYKGLMSSLKDPYSEYYTTAEFNEQMNQSNGIYYGIGAYISTDSNTTLPKISGVFKNSPAEEAGLRANDLVYMVGEEETYGLTLREVVSRIKGEENTRVVLTIIRDGETLEIPVTRRRVENPTVETKMLENGMGYLQITEFDDVTITQFLEGMSELYAAGMEGLILDLRSNPGGNLITVVQVAQNLLPEGVVVYTMDKEGRRTDYRCKGDKELQIPLVVLVDMNSASASEILAGAIQDYGKGTLVGTTTYGKGIVQSIIPSRDGSAIKITVSGYYTPNGRNIHKVGIEPDVVCEFDSSLYYDTENPVDNQLEKAKEILAEKMGN